MKLLLQVIFFCFPLWVLPQLQITGKVVDSRVKTPLAFVSVQLVGTNAGALSDIDGKFSISIPAGTEKAHLNFVYLGYETKSVDVNSIKNPGDFTVEMKGAEYSLQEVTVQAKENPAHRIIKNVTKNRDNNNPEKMRSFSYVSYNKMYVTADLAAKSDTGSMMDTTGKGLGNLLKKQHLFLTESVSERKYLHPGKNNEKVLASRVSGFKNSPFTMLATQMQSFSFYDDFINVFDKHYLNPVTEGSTKKYFFLIEDTLYNQNDSVFVISFRPKKDKNFDGMKGVLYINSDGWAIQNVIAEPVDKQGSLNIKIQQQYEKVEGKQWFPSKLNTDWIYMNTTIGDSSIAVGNKENSGVGKIKAIARTYISSISLNPEVKRKEFSEVELEMSSDADKRTEEFWNKYRIDSLTKKDQNTYKKIDSIGKAEKFDKKLLWFETFSTGKLNYGYIDFDLARILHVNAYEGLRPGVGIHTSKKLSQRFNAGGYVAYGFRDRTLKYGGDINLNVWKRKEFAIHAVYENDVIEAGGQSFFENRRNLATSEAYRDYYIFKMDRYVKYEFSADWRMFKYFRVNLFADQQQRWSERSYLMYDEEGMGNLVDTFEVNEVGVRMKFIFREKFLQTPRAKISMGSDYPVVYFNATKTVNEFAPRLTYFDFMRFDFRMDDAIQFRTIGRLSFSLQAGKVIGDVPYGFLYAMRASHFGKYSVSAMNTFETMRMNEFTSSEFVSLFINHNFGKFLKKREKFNPELELVHNMGIGRFENPYVHYNIGLKSMEKGYFESGIRINNLMKQNLLGYGVGVFYRYGPYALPTWDKNLYARFSVALSF